MSNFLCPVAFLLLLAAGTTDVTSAQTFESPKEEQGRLASMSQDAEKLSKITEKLRDIRKQRMFSLRPIDRKPLSVVEKWKQVDEALDSYISKFDDIHGASIVLLNVVSLSLYVTEPNLPPYYLSSICIYMPGEMGMITRLVKESNKKGEVVKFYRFIGEDVLERSEMNISMEGLQISEQLAHAYNLLCNRASRPENWIK